MQLLIKILKASINRGFVICIVKMRQVIFFALQRVIFSLRKSDITPFGSSDILFALNCPQDNITMRKHNITA